MIKNDTIKRTLPPLALAYEGDVDWDELPAETTDLTRLHRLGELVAGLSSKQANILKWAYLERSRVNRLREEALRPVEAVKVAHQALQSLNGTKVKKARREPLDALQTSAEEWHRQGQELINMAKVPVKLSAQARDIIRELAMSDKTKDVADALQQLIFGESLPPETISAEQVKTMKEIERCLGKNPTELSAFTRDQIDMYRRWVMGAFNPSNRRGSPIGNRRASKAYRSNPRKHPKHRI